MNNIVKIIKVIVVTIIIVSLFGLLMELALSFLSQNPNQEKRITLINFILPGLITVGFMIFGSIEMFIKRTNIKTITILLILFGILEVISVKWQFEFLLWSVKSGFFSEIAPISTGILIMIFVFVKLSLNLVEQKRIQT